MSSSTLVLVRIPRPSTAEVVVAVSPGVEVEVDMGPGPAPTLILEGGEDAHTPDLTHDRTLGVPGGDTITDTTATPILEVVPTPHTTHGDVIHVGIAHAPTLGLLYPTERDTKEIDSILTLVTFLVCLVSVSTHQRKT